MAETMTKYKIVKAGDVEGLEYVVQHWLELGWELYGPLVVDGGEGYTHLYQTVIFREEV